MILVISFLKLRYFFLNLHFRDHKLGHPTVQLWGPRGLYKKRILSKKWGVFLNLALNHTVPRKYENVSDCEGCFIEERALNCEANLLQLRSLLCCKIVTWLSTNSKLDLIWTLRVIFPTAEVFVENKWSNCVKVPNTGPGRGDIKEHLWGT